MITLVHQYFSQSAQRHPEKTAVSCEDESISFKDLEQFSNSFSRALTEAGASRGGFIPFFMKKSVNSIKSILSILKADCAYVPIDSNSPAQRLQAILNSTKAKLIVVNNDSEALLRELLGPDLNVAVVNIDSHTLGDTSAVATQNISIDLAYVLFTSGSTGVPKGVMIPHKAIIDYIDWCVETYELTDNDVISNHAPLYFDNSTFDLYTAFKTGATLHLVHEELNAVFPRLIKWLEERSITTFFCVPSVLTLLLKSRRLKQDSFPQLRHIICAGEVLPPNVLQSWMELYPDKQFTNMYGPTEITVDCSYHILTQVPDEHCHTIPIGKARNNMELFVRLEDGTLSQTSGDSGELLVRGTSVAYGYLGDSEKTAKAFIQNPNHSIYHDPLYCTGDLVKLNDAGEFEFLGRADDQIKFLGYRIELGEIEASLNKIAEVSEGVVVFNDSANEDEKEIGALVHLKQGSDVKELSDKLKTALPAYMVPTKIVAFDDEFPRTANGKYDRKVCKGMVFTKT